MRFSVKPARVAPLCVLFAVLLPTTGAGAQAPTPPSKPPDAKPAPPKPGTPKPYKEVITAEAKSEAGLFTVHRIEDKVYFEIPAALLNREMLWTTEIERLPAGFGYGGTAVGDRVVRWTRRNNKVYLRNVSHAVRADEPGAIQRAVEAVSLEPIILAFDVEAEGENKAAIIEVTRLFTGDIAEFSAKGPLGGTSVDASRSYVEKVKAFPTNIETKALMTYPLGGQPTGFFARRRPGGASSVTALIHYSMVLLPEKPMQGRLFDSRVGFFTESFEDYGRPENRVVRRRYITRYRLEKRDPTAKVSEPIQPIVFYISRETPEKWRPFIKKGVEAWQEAFEGAGFKNAILCKEAPDDPHWDHEDARYSVIRWAPTDTENAMGPHVHDPRSGEIISAHIIVWHNALKMLEDWYFPQCAAQDPRARKLPLPESLMGELMQYVISHEVGHTLGLEHNFKASSSYTVAQLRDPTFTAKYGDEASIMDYGRFNYVAQPGDNARLIPLIGPYDRFAIAWGYTPFPGCKTPDDEKTALDAIAARQVHDPMLRFGNSRFEDPTQQTEDLGSDPIEATRLGLQNIARVAKLLVPATTKFGEDYSRLQEMFSALFGQQQTELYHVAALIGGVVETDYHAGRGSEVYRPVPRERQADALKFLLAHGFSTPRRLLLPDILYRIEPSGVADRVLNSQRGLLGTLLDEGRIKRMLDNQVLNPGRAYTVAQLVADLQDGLWSELARPKPAIDLYRRNLQRAYLQTMKTKLVGDGATQTDLRPIATGALRGLALRMDAALPKAQDPITALHLRDCRTAIERILNPKS